MQAQTTIQLSDGQHIPQVGLGVWKASNEEAAFAVKTALEVGYRHIDTATIYENEEGVGQGIMHSGIARADIFVTTKLWNAYQGFDSTLKAFDESLKKLQLDYLDLYLIHWPLPKRDLYVDTWRAFIRLQQEGRIKSIGVSNFEVEHIERLVKETGVKPVINQIENHPQFQQHALRQFLSAEHIATEAWSPLGQGTLLTHPLLQKIAQKHGRTAAQVIIRWHIENGTVVIPKSVHAERIAENFKVFDFALDADDKAVIATLDKNDGRIGPDPKVLDFVGIRDE